MKPISKQTQTIQFSFQMTFSTTEDFVSSPKFVPFTTEEGTTEFQVLDLDFLEEIIEIQRDILNEQEKDKRSYMTDFDFDYDYPEYEYSEFGADLRGARV